MSTSDDNDFLNDKDRRYFDLMFERLLDQNKTILESLGDMQAKVAKLPKMEEDVAELRQDMKIVKAAVTDASRQVHDHERRITRLETAS